MQVTDAMVEKAARAMCIEGGFDPDQRMPNDGPLWRYYADGARAALTAALVDVPAEPVAWLPADDAPRGVYALIKHRSGQLDLCYKTDNGEPFLETWRYAGTAKRGEQAPWPESYIPVSDLRTSPPLSREGEDSAVEIPADIVERCAEILEWKRSGRLPGNALRELGQQIADRLGGSLFIDNGLKQAELATTDEALKLVVSLAATRSGSATTPTGTDPSSRNELDKERGE